MISAGWGRCEIGTKGDKTDEQGHSSHHDGHGVSAQITIHERNVLHTKTVFKYKNLEFHLVVISKCIQIGRAYFIFHRVRTNRHLDVPRIIYIDMVGFICLLV